MLAFLNTPTFPVFSPPTYLIFYLAFIYCVLLFTNIIYHVMHTDTCNKPHTLRDAVTGRNRNVDETVQPVAQPMRRLPFGLRDKVDEKLDELLEKGIIEDVPSSPTTWLSPLVVVGKPDGDIRICVDMRRANEAVVREIHPIPTI